MSQPPTPPNYPSVPPASGYNASTPTYGAPQGGNYYPGAQNDKTNTLAIISLVSAFVISLVAVITGHMALGQIKRTGEKGRGLAIAGLVLGYLGIVSGIITSIVLIVMLVAGVGIFAAAAGSAYDDYDDYTSTSDPYATDEPGLGGSDITFSDGAALTSSDVVQFADPFMAGSDWTVDKVDDGKGTWSYTDPSGFCTAQFHQGAIDSALVVSGDDSATTDAMLASLLSSTPDALSSYLSDDTFAAGYGGDGSIADTRSISSTNDDGSSTVFAGRAFAGIPAGLYVIIDCAPDGDIDSVYDEVKTSASMVIG